MSRNLAQQYSAINHIISPFVEYHKNLVKLAELKESIGEDTYKAITKQLKTFKPDNTLLVKQLSQCITTGFVEPVKADSSTEESDEEVLSETSPTPTKKFTKRLQFKKKEETKQEEKKKPKRLF
jgi:hypothetical protein